MLVFLLIKCVLYVCSTFSGADVFTVYTVLSRKTSKVKTIPKRLGRVARAKPVNIDTERRGGMNGVSVLSGLNFEKMRGLTFPEDKENCPRCP